jgi:MATE family multidrug resistance protein
MLVNFVGYWAIGLPAGYVLCFSYGFGVYGLWCGLTLALVIIALILLHTWQRESRALVSSSLRQWSESSAPVER